MEYDGSNLHHTIRIEAADVPMKVRRRSFRQFSHWMNQELAKLVSRWSHTAAPSALRISRRVNKPHAK